MDENDVPLRLADVFEIRDLDISPFVVSRVAGSSRLLEFMAPQGFNPTLDDSGTLS